MDYYIGLHIEPITEEISDEDLMQKGFFKLEGKNGNAIYAKRVILPKFSSQLNEDDIKFIEKVTRDHNVIKNHPTTYKKYEVPQDKFETMEQKPQLQEKDGVRYWTEAIDISDSREVNVYNIVKEPQSKKRKRKQTAKT